MKREYTNKRTLFRVILTYFVLTAIMMGAFYIRSEAAVSSGLISDGVYSIQNKASGKYLKIENNSVYTYKNVIQSYYSSAPSSESTRSGLFKFSHRGSNNYLIRTMTNNGNIIKRINDSTIQTRAADPVDSNNPANMNWILYSAGGDYYYLKAYGTEKYLCAPVNNNDLYCTTETFSSTNERAKWKLNLYTGSAFSGAKVNYAQPQITDIGSMLNISDSSLITMHFYSTVVGVNSRGTLLNYTVNSPSGDASNIAYMSGSYLNGLNGRAGMVSVSVTFSNATAEPFNIYFKPTYGEFFFLQNIQNTTGCIKSTGTYSQKDTFNYDDKQIWRRLNAGSISGVQYYYIKNMDGKYLTAPSSSANGERIIMESALLTGSDLDRQKWRFEDAPSNSGGTRIQSASMGNFWLNVSNNSSTSGYLTQSDYTYDTIYYDEFNVVMLGNEVVYHRTFEYFPEISAQNIVKNLYNHYNSFELVYLQNHLGTNEVVNDPDACFNIALDMLENSKVTIFAGHGSASSITVSELDKQYCLKNTHIYNGSIDLSDVDIVIFDGCETAGSPTSGLLNLPDSAEVVGAKVAIGWSSIVYSSGQMRWINKFFELMNTIDDDTQQMYTAAKAVEDTNDYITGTSGNAVISGTNIYFSFD